MSVSAVLSAVSGVTADIGSIKKAGFNKFHQYGFVQASDVMHKLQPLLVKHGLIIFQSEKGRSIIGDEAMSIQYEFTLAHVSGEIYPEKLEQTGLATCRNSKGGFDDKAANKCATAAHKYMVINLFKIPTGEFDDADSQEDQPEAPKPANDNVSPPPAANDNNPAPATPYEIALTKKPKSDAADWVAWGSRFVAGVNTATTENELRDWTAHNSRTLDECEKAAPKVFKQITTRLAEARVVMPIISAFALARTKDALSEAWEKNKEAILSLGETPYDRLAGSFEYHVNRIRDDGNKAADGADRVASA